MTLSSCNEAHELLKKYYHHLLVNTEEGNEALSYLLKRGITKEMIEKFEIGYASPAWDAATKILQKKRFIAIKYGTSWSSHKKREGW